MNTKLVACLVLMLWGTGNRAAAYQVGDIVNDFTLPALNNGTPSLHDHLGSVVVLSFFATWCIGCNEEADRLENAIWRGRNVTVIAVDINEPVSLVQGWAAALGVTYHIWLAPDWNLFLQFPNSTNIPYNAVLGPGMELRYASIGFDLNAINATIDTILAEGQVPTATRSWSSIKALFR